MYILIDRDGKRKWDNFRKKENETIEKENGTILEKASGAIEKENGTILEKASGTIEKENGTIFFSLFLSVFLFEGIS